MLKKAILPLFAGSLVLLPFATQARATNLTGGLQDFLSSLTGGTSGNDHQSSSDQQAQQIGQSVTDIVHQGQNIGQQAQDIAHQF
jgi:hypothetical protein